CPASRYSGRRGHGGGPLAMGRHPPRHGSHNPQMMNVKRNAVVKTESNRIHGKDPVEYSVKWCEFNRNVVGIDRNTVALTESNRIHGKDPVGLSVN
ncbi:hypothetical protein ACLOJK_034895, partial [Asimina triloba]